MSEIQHELNFVEIFKIKKSVIPLLSTHLSIWNIVQFRELQYILFSFNISGNMYYQLFGRLFIFFNSFSSLKRRVHRQIRNHSTYSGNMNEVYVCLASMMHSLSREHEICLITTYHLIIKSKHKLKKKMLKAVDQIRTSKNKYKIVPILDQHFVENTKLKFIRRGY